MFLGGLVGTPANSTLKYAIDMRLREFSTSKPLMAGLMYSVPFRGLVEDPFTRNNVDEGASNGGQSLIPETSTIDSLLSFGV